MAGEPWDMTGDPRRDGATEQGMTPNLFLDDRLGALRRARFHPSAIALFAAEMWRRAGANAAARPELRRELRWIAAVGLLPVMLAGAAMIAEGVPPGWALTIPPLAWLLLCGWVRVELGLVRHPITDMPSPAIGPANVISLYRGWAAAPIIVLGLSHDSPTLMAVALGVTAAITDLVDGTIAVRLGHESRLGRLVDPVLDSFLFSAIAFDLARWGLLPWWMAALVAVRYFAVVIGGLALLFIRGRSLPVRHTPWGQRSTLAIGAALGLTLASRYVVVPAALLLTAYVVAVAIMVVALLGIIRRVPAAPGGAGP